MGINLFGGVEKAGKDVVDEAAGKVSGQVIPAGEQAVAQLLDQIDALLTKQQTELFQNLATFRDETLNALDQKIEAKIDTLKNLKIGLSI